MCGNIVFAGKFQLTHHLLLEQNTSAQKKRKNCDKILENLLIVFVVEVAIQYKQWEAKAGLTVTAVVQ